MSIHHDAPTAPAAEPGLLEALEPVAAQWRRLIGIPLACGALAVAASFLMKPVYTSEVVLLPPSNQSASLAALSGALGGGAAALVGSGLGGALKDPNDQWIGLLKSRTIADALVDRFGLLEAYAQEHRLRAREALADNTRIEVNRQGLISLRVDDHDPARAQAMARAYVAELQKLSNALAVTAAAKRRVFFEQQLETAGKRLAQAEAELQGVGVRDEVIKANPQATLEAIGELQRNIVALEVQISGLRSVLAEGSAPLVQAEARLALLKQRLGALQSARAPAPGGGNGGDYIARYRAFKYAEVVFEGIARQLELARLEEAREGALVQVVDEADLPELKTRPKRAFIGVFTSVGVGLLMFVGILLRRRLDALRATGDGARAWDRLRRHFTRR